MQVAGMEGNKKICPIIGRNTISFVSKCLKLEDLT